MIWLDMVSSLIILHSFNNPTKMWPAPFIGIGQGIFVSVWDQVGRLHLPGQLSSGGPATKVATG